MKPQSEDPETSPLLVRRIVRMTGTALLGAVVIGFLVMFLLPLAKPIAFAAVLAIACIPLQRAMLWVMRGHRGFAAFATTIIVVVVGVVPAVYLGSMLTVEAGKAYQGLRARVVGGELQQRVDGVAATTRSILPAQMAEDAVRQIEHAVSEMGSSALRVISQKLVRAVNTALENLPVLMLDLVVMLLSVFIFLRDGHKWIAAWKVTVPLPAAFRDMLANRIRDTTVAVVHGMFIAAIAQSLLLGLGFKLFGVPLPVLFGVAGFFASLIPYIGVAIIWVPAALWLWLGQDAPGRAIGLFVYGGAIISSIDNVVKPMVIGGGAHLPAYSMFIAIMGGIFALGPLGLFLGPVVFAVAFATLSTYRDMVTVTARNPAGGRRAGDRTSRKPGARTRA